MTMEDKDRSPLEERLLALLEPDEAAVRRVKERALSASSQPHLSLRFLAVAGGLLALLGTCVVWQAATRQPERQVVTIDWSENDLMLVRTPDGSVWVLGPAEEQLSPPGTMEVVLEGGR
jgi:hypothetical protein